MEPSQPSDQKQSSDRLREATVRLLRNSSNIMIAANEAEADRILSVTNQIYIKGYLSRNPRVRYRNSDSRPVYAGYVSVELRDRQDEVIWSYLFTPNRFGAEDISKNLADQIVNKLLQFLSSQSKTP